MKDVRILRRSPDTGETRCLIIFLHGYGADGADLFGLAEPMSPSLPNCAFVAPDAPEPCAVNPIGRQWFPIPHMDGSSPEAMSQSFARSAEFLDKLITSEIERAGTVVNQTLLFGFSQGTMMALHVAFRRASRFAGVAGFSGRLLYPEKLHNEIVSRPPVLLVHGDSDEIVPTSSMVEAKAALETNGVAVETRLAKNLGHGIDPDGISAAIQFARSNLAV